jgi:drug/metabolite transporter (DMT)-like permease
MGDMQEIVSVEQVHRLFVTLAVVLPLVGLIFGALLGVRRGNVKRGALQGLLLGILGPVNFGLWLVYNAITDRLGLDTVKNLLVNLALFVVLGVVTGLVAGQIMRRGDESSAKEPTPATEPPREA